MNLAVLLSAIAEGGANGAVLAERFGVSRTMIWKGMQALRMEGLHISGEAGMGYELIDPSGFGPHTLSWRLDREVAFFDSCGSTNVEARRRAESSDEPEGIIVVANQQESGRGRLGRTWDAEANQNLLFSVVLAPSVIPQMAPVCVLAWAAAMADVMGCQVKWPNDLVTPEGKKIGGILAELSAEAEHVRFIVMGVGVNVNQMDFPGLPMASSLRLETGETHDRALLLGHLIKAIEGVNTNGVPCLDQWRSRSHTLGKRVQVGTVNGIAEAVREDGALIVDGTPVLAGDVELVAE